MILAHKHGLIYSRSCIFTQSVRNIGKDVELFNVSTYQYSIFFNNLGSFQSEEWIPEAREPEGANYQGCRIQYRWSVATQGNFGKQLCSCYLDGRGGQIANRHKAVAWGLRLGGMPINKKQWFVSTCKNWFHRSCSSSLGINRRREFSHAAILEMKLGKESERVITYSRGRTADALFMNLESVALAIEGSDISIPEDNFVPTARWIQDTNKGNWWPDQVFQRLRCCVCHLHYEQAMKAPHRVRQFRKSTQEGTTLQCWCYCWRCQCGSKQV